ncbi:DUF1510 family protein [Virgibacillus sp. DJP39]|uniref:YrrS family protein n=1 Tax=Virgibacillus sp. DJP39 TaxID=3409790 RepID=UPI003BB5C6FE
MNDFDTNSRVDKFEKRRKNTKSISIFLVLGGLLIIVLLGVFIFGGDDKEKAESGQPSTEPTSEDNSTDNGQSNSEKEEAPTDQENDAADDQDKDNTTSEDTSTSGAEDDPEKSDEKTTEDGSTDSSGINKESVAGSGDNVKEAYTADWEPIGTEQEGTHTKNFDEGTQDRIEMEKALRLATGLQDGDMITWWLHNAGGQEVIGTVSSKAQEETYRVYLTWVDNKGWKPTKVEILKVNDKKNNS